MDSLIWTFFPGLHGTSVLYEPIREMLPSGVVAEFMDLPSTGKQDYDTLTAWMQKTLPTGKKRLLIAESFSGPLALRLAEKRASEVAGIVLAASFCNTPFNPGITLLPLRPLFMVKPPRKALRHFLIGEDASEAELTALRAVVQSIPSSTLTRRVRAILELMEDDNPPLADLPMLILQAQNDNLIPWEAQRKLEACYPHADTHWIDSPHLLLQRCPGECLAHIRAFAKECS